MSEASTSTTNWQLGSRWTRIEAECLGLLGPNEGLEDRCQAGKQGHHLVIVSNEMAVEICEAYEMVELFLGGRSRPHCHHTHLCWVQRELPLLP